LKLALPLLLASTSPAMAQVHDHASHEPPAPTAPALPSSVDDHAADAIFGADAMRASRDALREEHGDVDHSLLQFDMFELRPGKGSESLYWDATASFGGDVDRIEIKSAGEAGFGRGVDYSDNELLWSHAVGPWYNLKLGLRYDAGPGPDLAHAAAGVAGTAPFNLDVEAMTFLSEEGDLTGHIKAEHDVQLTQQLVARPQVQLDFASSAIPELGIGHGLSCMTAGLRLRYEIAPEFAPYIGVEWARGIGQTARYARAGGDDPESTVFVAGLRFWF
jgi:copper resistance protein B